MWNMFKDTFSKPEKNKERAGSILVIEPDLKGSVYLNKILSKNSYKAMLTENHAEAVEMIKAHIPDLIILSSRFGNKSNVRFCERLKKARQTRSIPVLLALGSSEHTDAYTYMKNKTIDDYFMKPVIVEELLDSIKKLI